MRVGRRGGGRDLSRLWEASLEGGRGADGGKRCELISSR